LLEKLMAERFDAVILSDYDKGVIVPTFLEQVLPAMASRRVPVFVDPRPRHATSYRPISVITPNRREAELMVGFAIHTDKDLRRAAQKLLEMTQGQAVLITRGDQGMALMERRANLRDIPTQAREVYDVTGAGDTVIATLALARAAGAGFTEAAVIANYAAGLV